MAATPLTILRRALVVVVALLICKVTVVVMLGYSNYFPPNFQSDFLHGRDGYFFGAYRWAFYPHIASGPVALFLGMLLISERFRLRFPKWHRRLGRVHVLNVLLVVSPSGLWMAYRTSTGTIAAISFALLAVATATCSALGWRAAVRRQFAIHRRWMTRSFLLLCSAVVLRVFGGLGTVLEVRSPWFDPLASWASWLVPLILLELSRLKQWRTVRL
ncbi:MAG: DUF2306 domain-containing protein [Planctomycetaceae bacterium]